MKKTIDEVCVIRGTKQDPSILLKLNLLADLYNSTRCNVTKTNLLHALCTSKFVLRPLHWRPKIGNTVMKKAHNLILKAGDYNKFVFEYKKFSVCLKLTDERTKVYYEAFRDAKEAGTISMKRYLDPELQEEMFNSAMPRQFMGQQLKLVEESEKGDYKKKLRSYSRTLARKEEDTVTESEDPGGQ